MNLTNLTTLILILAQNDGAVRRAIVALATRAPLLSDTAPSRGKLSDRAEVRYMANWILDGEDADNFLATPGKTGKSMTIQRAWRWKPARNNPEIARALVLRNAELVFFVLHQIEDARRAAAARLLDFDAADAEPVTKRYGT